MNAIATVTDRFKGTVHVGLNVIRTRLFGANNEKLDFFMDSFYKLTPPQRTAALAGFVAAIAFCVLLAVLLYFAQANRLKADLNSSFAALHELDSLKLNYQNETANFDKLLKTVANKTQQVKMKPFFEKIANEQGVTIEGLNEKREELPGDNPMAGKVALIKVEMRLPNISVPRLLNFVVEVEKAGNYVRVQDLTVRAKYGTKLFFDAQILARGYDVTQ
jgi:hypothetical protein